MYSKLNDNLFVDSFNRANYKNTGSNIVHLSDADFMCWLLGTSIQKKGSLRAIYWSYSACRREATKVESEDMHVFHALVSFFLFAKEKPVFPVLIPTKQRLALRFHALYDGIGRGLQPRSTSILLRSIAGLSRAE